MIHLSFGKKELSLIFFCWISNIYRYIKQVEFVKYLSNHILSTVIKRCNTLLIDILSRVFYDTKITVCDDIFNPDTSKMYHIKRGGGVYHNKFLPFDYMYNDRTIISNLKILNYIPINEVTHEQVR